jgi:hypothetical protein
VEHVGGDRDVFEMPDPADYLSFPDSISPFEWAARLDFTVPDGSERVPDFNRFGPAIEMAGRVDDNTIGHG